MRERAGYLRLVTPRHARRLRFMATIEATVGPFADAQDAFAAMPLAYDLDLAEGVQLDAVGEWVGRSRYIPIPVPDPWFRWGDAKRGWGVGYWKGVFDSGERLARLDDRTYRQLLRAKILANYSDGTIAGAQRALDAFFGAPTILRVMDRSRAVGWTPSAPSAVEMRWQIAVAQKIPDGVRLEVLAQNLIPTKPAGVNLDIRVTTVDNSPLFGWGMSNDLASGWGQGAWGASPEYVAQNIV